MICSLLSARHAEHKSDTKTSDFHRGEWPTARLQCEHVGHHGLTRRLTLRRCRSLSLIGKVAALRMRAWRCSMLCSLTMICMKALLPLKYRKEPLPACTHPCRLANFVSRIVCIFPMLFRVKSLVNVTDNEQVPWRGSMNCHACCLPCQHQEADGACQNQVLPGFRRASSQCAI